MPTFEGLRKPFQPDWEGLVNNIARRGTPDRAYHLELFHDSEIEEAIIERFDIGSDLNANDPNYARHLHLAFLRFLGFDYVCTGPVDQDWHIHRVYTEDAAPELSRGERTFFDEHTGPITNWEQFEQFPWPDPNRSDLLVDLEWYNANLPDDMCIIAGGAGHFSEFLNWLLGYETLCYALYDQRDLVKAIADRLHEYFRVLIPRLLQFDRVKVLFPSDDLGFKSGTLISPADTRGFILPGHKMVARMAHDAGRLCILHTCGNLKDIIDDLIDDCRIDGKHSFEDTIEDVRDVKSTYGQRIALLGGIDVDFLCRADEPAIRRRVRETLDVCQDGGGFCLGTGNSPANYIPVDNYLAMVDEGRLYGG